MVRPKHITKESNRMANAQRIVVHMSYWQMKKEQQRQQEQEQRLQEQDRQRQFAHQRQREKQQRQQEQEKRLQEQEALQQHQEQEQREQMMNFGLSLIASLLQAWVILDDVWQSNKEWLNQGWLSIIFAMYGPACVCWLCFKLWFGQLPQTQNKW